MYCNQGCNKIAHANTREKYEFSIFIVVAKMHSFNTITYSNKSVALYAHALFEFDLGKCTAFEI